MANKINGNDVPQPLPCPPFHNITGLDNFRDIGGYVSSIRSSSGALQQVRRGIVFRSADPSHVVDEGIAAMAALGISTVYDLRSGPEVSKPGKVKEWAGAKRVFLPVFLDEDYSPEAIAHRFKNYASKGSEGFVWAYTTILSSSASPTHPKTPLRTILNHLLGKLTTTTTTTTTMATKDDLASPLSRAYTSFLPSPFLLHCAGGKDRTGVLTAVILSLLGVDNATIANEYALTELGLATHREIMVSRLLADPAFADLGIDEEGIRRFSGAKRENMLAFLAHVKERYGGIEAVVRTQAGLTSEELAALRAVMLVAYDTEVKSVGGEMNKL